MSEHYYIWSSYERDSKKCLWASPHLIFPPESWRQLGGKRCSTGGWSSLRTERRGQHILWVTLWHSLACSYNVCLFQSLPWSFLGILFLCILCSLLNQNSPAVAKHQSRRVRELGTSSLPTILRNWVTCTNSPTYFCCCCCCSVAKSCPTLWDPMNCSTPGFLVLHCLVEYAQIHARCLSDAISPSHPLLSKNSPFAFTLSQDQGDFSCSSNCHILGGSNFLLLPC